MPTAEKISVLVVDDSEFIRQVLSDILNADPQITVVGEAADGLEALDKLEKLSVDVVTLDLDMPKLDGLATLKQIMQKSKSPAVLVVSSYTQDGAAITLSCLEAGAVDFVLKFTGSASGNLHALAPEIIKKVKVASAVNTEKLKHFYSSTAPIAASQTKDKRGVVVIGSSTGGTVALERILLALPDNFPSPVLIAQHLPAKFVESLVTLLSEISKLPIKVGTPGAVIEPGTIYFAPGGADMEVTRRENEVKVIVKENKGVLTPSVDALMISTAHVYGEKTLGVILTGMGNDGLAGMRVIKEVHGKTLVQDEATSVVFGMGQEVVKAGLADEQVPLEQMANKIVAYTYG